MEDERIVELYWQRMGSAVSETETKYGAYCYGIAYRILGSHEDAEECVNDTYLRAWNAMPDQRPRSLMAFLGRIVRGLSLDRYRRYSAKKRGGGQVMLALSELEDCVPAPGTVEQEVEGRLLAEQIGRFLCAQPERERDLFIRRYWYLYSVPELAAQYRTGEDRVRQTLLRTRKRLRQFLETEGSL